MSSSLNKINNLISTYAFLVDDGDFAGLGRLLDHAEFTLGTTSVRGGVAVEQLAHSVLQTFADGTPRTRHVTTNLIVDIDEAAGSATSRSYYTVVQQTDDFPLQPIASGRYRDRFELADGEWRFVERSVRTDLVGDTSHHVKQRA